MLPTATIVFREIIEVALVITIVLAATRGLPSRLNLILSGLAMGICGSLIIAFFTESISQAVEGMGQEIFNACIMFTAVAFLSWTVIWMKRHGREMVQNINEIGDDILRGDKSVYAIVAVVALATFREGAEIVLFSYGMLASGAYPVAELVAGGLMGAVGGIIVGALIYFGLLRAFQKHLLIVTSWMLIVLTAGLAAQGTNFLIAANILPTLHPELWDTSAILGTSGFFAETVSVLTGYTPRPTGMEFLVYALTLAVIIVAYKKAPTIGQSRGKKIQSQALQMPAE